MHNIPKGLKVGSTSDTLIQDIPSLFWASLSPMNIISFFEIKLRHLQNSFRELGEATYQGLAKIDTPWQVSPPSSHLIHHNTKCPVPDLNGVQAPSEMMEM